MGEPERVAKQIHEARKAAVEPSPAGSPNGGNGSTPS